MPENPDEGTTEHEPSKAVRSVRVASVLVSVERRATVRDAVVTLLMASLDRRGLLSPIRVRSDLSLICGLHRLVAHERLGWTMIDALICDDADPIEIELDEIEENLCRKELTVLERARDELRQKELYLMRNPATRQGTAGAVARHEGVQAKHVSFAEQRASEVGGSKRMVEQRVQIATTLGDEGVAKLGSHPIADNHRQLLDLARLPDLIRSEAVERIADGRAQKVKQAVAQITRVEPTPRVERSPRGEGLLVQTDTGYRGEATLNGRRVSIEFGRDHRAMSVLDLGPVVIEAPLKDSRRLTTELSFALVHEVMDELPSDLALDVALSEVSDEPPLACVRCGCTRFYRDQRERCAACEQRRHVIGADLYTDTFSREHPRKRQVIEVRYPGRAGHRTLTVEWSRGQATDLASLGSLRGWAPESIPEAQTVVEFNGAACRWSCRVESIDSPGVAGFKAALAREILRVLQVTHGLQRRGARFFRFDGTEVVLVRRRG